MKTVVYSTKPYDERFLGDAVADSNHTLHFLETRLTHDTVELAKGSDAVCVFVNDVVDATTIEKLSEFGVRLIALRCAGFNNVDLNAAEEHGLMVTRVPAYSPHAVAEHTAALLMTLNRNIHRAYGRVRDGNFLLDGLLGFDLHGRSVGIIGTGQIGLEFARIMKGFGCELLGFDIHPNPECVDLGMEYLELDQLFSRADILSLHCPLTPETHHLIDDRAIEKMKQGVTIINTSRGAVIDTQAVVRGLKSGRVGHLGLDVYEEEADYFFEDVSNSVISDDTLARLMTFPNVLVTGHQAFFTEEAMTCIAQTTIESLTEFETDGKCKNEVSAS